jgi:hypothetical protein
MVAPEPPPVTMPMSPANSSSGGDKSAFADEDY